MTAAQMDSIRIAAADKAAKKRLNSGAQAVDFTDDDRNRFSTVAQMIQARFSGVSVSQRGAGYQIRIRGSESFSSGIEPLLIVDGAQMNSTADLASVNPKDVARIEILKDAAASIYGVRGGNGVIVVTTRRIP
jgi:TonB-dependent SusC/RagA subfamily outer membrane receptor